MNKYILIVVCVFTTSCMLNKQSNYIDSINDCAAYSSIEDDLIGEYDEHDEMKSFLPGFFSFSPVGIGAMYMEQYINIWKISKSTYAERYYLSVIESGKVCGKLYGLVGLKIIKSKAFDIKAKELKKITDPIDYGPYGCVTYSQPVKKIVDDIIENDLVDPAVR